ncbi:hypothetical protein BgAZ_404220 [Babesia gibsoni]|uniref:Uncharacterized protein n=1 Tax=Babesia gibsoni TaxID=33632 RepID=A0AAD8LQ99_BABGI|nr:hypothetical protein BgAZ_404220 [Babesia gibsoni]
MVVCDSGNWLHQFRQSLKAQADAEEFVKFATSYSPHVSRRNRTLGKEACDGGEHKETQSRFPSEEHVDMCGDIVIGTVADVYSCGARAFVRSRDVQLDLAKIYLLLSAAKKRLHCGEQNGSINRKGVISRGNSSDYLDVTKAATETRNDQHLLDIAIKRFECYVVTSMALAEECPFAGMENEDTSCAETTVHETYQHTFMNYVSNFRINPTHYRHLTGATESEEDIKIAVEYTNHVTMLSWDFYRDATCSDIFKLLCYSLAQGNFEAYKVILQNNQSCMMRHVQEHWGVLLSYIPVVCIYRKFRGVIENVFKVNGEMSYEACINAIDWTIWRSFIILKSTRCSYYLLLKFLKNMSALWADLSPRDETLISRLHVVSSLLTLVKQYVLYSNIKVGLSLDLKEPTETAHLKLTSYLQLKAAERLQLFIDCIEMSNVTSDECECDQLFKDKHKIYTSCLHCNTVNGINRLTTFIKLINVANQKQQCENQFCTLNSEFSDFFGVIKDCAYASINDYMEGIYTRFCGTLNEEVFMLLYILTKAMLVTDFSYKTRTTVLGILYNSECSYNVLDNYFLFKSVISLLDVNMHETDGQRQKEMKEPIAVLVDSYLGGMVKVDPPKQSDTCRATHQNPKYAEFLRDLVDTKGTLTLPLALKAVRCQLGFVEAVLDLLSLMSILPTNGRNLHLSIDELTKALYDSDTALLLVQRVLVYIMKQGIPTSDFRNCIYALQDIAAYINGVSVNDLHMMFLYTICICSDNVQYLSSQVNVWLTQSNRDVNHVMMFLKSSLTSVRVTLYTLSTRLDVNFSCSKLITDLACGFPKEACEALYLRHPVSSSSLGIKDLLEVYLKSVGIDWDGEILSTDCAILHLIENVSEGLGNGYFDEVKKDLRKLGALQRVSTVLTTFHSNFKRFAITKNMLNYRFYESKVELMEDTLGSIAYACSKHHSDVFCGPQAHWILFILDSVLCGAFNDDSGFVYGAEETLNRLQQIKTVAFLVLPKEIRKDAEDILDVLIWAIQDGNSRASVEPKQLSKAALSAISAMLFGSSYMKLHDYVGLAKLCGQTGKEELPDMLSFFMKQICNWERSDPKAIADAKPLNASSITLFEVLTNPDYNNDNKLSTDNHPEVDDFIVRSCILKLLSKVNLAKLEVCQNDKMKISFDKLTHRFTGNTASGLLSRALGKAETGLSSITMKKMQFETLKGKFFTTSKKSANTFNGCFLPVLNFYNTAVLCISDYDFCDANNIIEEPATGKDLMKWRSVSGLDVLGLLKLDPNLGVIRLLEICNYTFNDVFVEQLHRVFHNFNVSQCLRVLDTLSLHLRRLRWSDSLFVHLEAIRKFLKNFSSFPSDTDIYIGRFIASSKYRVSLFSELAGYVADHIKEFLHIYICLDALFACQEFGAESPRKSRIEFNLQNIIEALWTDAPVPEMNIEISDELLMQEYICVLMKSLEKTFWASDLHVSMERFKPFEPEFLQLQEQYRDCLISMYQEYKRSKLHRPEHWICWRKLVYRYLVIYPEDEHSFNMLYQPHSMDVIHLLEVVKQSTEGLDITEVDNYETFKRQLVRKLTLQNYSAVVEAMKHFDVYTAKAILENMGMHLREVEEEDHFDATRQLYYFYVESAKQW